MDPQEDRKALLGRLRIDRSQQPASPGRPLKWLALIALAAGLGFVAWFFRLPGGEDASLVSTAVAAPAPAGAQSSVLDATGYVVARRQATVSSKATGKVVEVLIEEGVTVAEGQLLARLDDSVQRAELRLAESQLEAARRTLLEVEAQLEQARLDLARSEGLAVRSLVSEAELDRNRLEVEAAAARLERLRQEAVVAQRVLAVQRQLLDDMEIRAPFAGVVIAKAAQPGEMISPVSAGGGFTRTGICTIVDMGSLEVEVDVNEAYINRVHPDQPVRVTLNAYPEEAYAAEVIATIPAAERSKATVRVRVGFLERDERVLPDMGVRVAFLDAAAESPAAPPPGVFVPSAAVAEDHGKAYVLVVADEKVQRRAIRLGGAERNRVQILAGLRPGERVVTNLNDKLLASLTDGAAVSWAK